MNAKLLVYDDDGHPVEIIDARRCDSKGHEPRLATTLVHWVTGPIDYCSSCAEKMIEVAVAYSVLMCIPK